jgi:hypothetical protein
VPLYVLPLNGFTEDRLKLDDPVSMDRLYQMVKTMEPVMVVLDVLRELHDHAEDSADEMAPVLRPARQMAHAENFALVVTHHHNRGGSFRGSTAIRAAFDYEMAFARQEDSTHADDVRGALKIEGRYGPRETIAVRLGAGLRWEPTTATVHIGEAGLRERILASLVESDDWLTPEDLASRLGVALKTVQNELTRMVKEEPAPFAVCGPPRKNNPRRFHALTQRLWEDHPMPAANGSRFPSPLMESGIGNHFSSRPNGSGNHRNDTRDAVAGDYVEGKL